MKRPYTFAFLFAAGQWLFALSAWAIDTTPSRNQPGEIGISVGAEFTSGDYGGTANTDILYLPVTFSYETERWLWWLTVPYLRVSGPGNVVIIGGGGMGGHMTTTTTTARRTESGLGDIIAGASYRLLTQTETRPAIDIAGKLYLGTADKDKGLGTGENDVAAQVSVTKDIHALTLSGTAGYLITGDPSGVTYRDVFYGRIDAEHRFNRNTVGAALDAQEALVTGSNPSVKLTGYFSTRPGDHTKLTIYLLHGLTDSAPDYGFGVSIGVQY